MSEAASAKMKWTYMLINQILMSIKDEFIRQKYYHYIKDNKIEIVSDIFERMDMDRALNDELRKLQKESNDGATMEAFK